MSIRELQIEAYKTACNKGWHGTKRTVGELIALCHSELSEALEEYRETGKTAAINTDKLGDKPEGFGIELADCIIRIADMAEALGIDLEYCIEIKMNYNRSRSYRHGGKKL